jgi:energy-coupling factor transporter ATP-binding protein EcfA2
MSTTTKLSPTSNGALPSKLGPAMPVERVFLDSPAVRERVPLLVGLVGPSGSGKTFSALRLAAGIQRVDGGDIYVVDTEARRALHYADRFEFRHVEFGAPFGPLDYLAAVDYCVGKGAKIIIVDSMSHEHEGPGGVLEMHEQETQRLVSQWKSTPDKVKFSAWVKPKAERRRLLNSIVQRNAHFIFCFRAKEKLKIIPGKEPVHLGWQAIAGEEFIYEMTMSLYLPPGGKGKPDLAPQEIGEKALLKIPIQFQQMVHFRELDEETGSALARWAAGDAIGGQTAGKATPQTSKPSSGQPGASPEASRLLLGLNELLTVHLGTDKAAREAAILESFGADRKVVAKMQPPELAVGLAALRANLEGLAVMRQGAAEREPGEDG